VAVAAHLLSATRRAQEDGDVSVGRYTQLMGNHEAFHVDQPIFHWPDELSAQDHATLCSWWGSRSMRVSAGVRTKGREYLLTHAGLTNGLWRRMGSPARLEDAVAALEALRDEHPLRLFRAGAMLGALEPDFSAGPLWAEAPTELAASWTRDPMPFSQVHGHSSSYWWSSGEWLVPPGMREGVDRSRRHVTVKVGGGRLVGIDPNHGTTPSPWAPLLLEGEVLL
jgi:hypothetical protein